MLSDEIIIYQPDAEVRLDVRLEDETVWLTQAQMAELFNTTPQNITMHIRAVYADNELSAVATCKDFLQVRQEGGRKVQRKQKIYNLDVIISVGYRVKSKRGVQFRQWANKVLKEYLLRGYAVNNRFERLEQRVAQTEEKIDFFVRTSLPPVEGIFYDGQVFDAYTFASDLIRSAKHRVVLIDNYVDDSVLTLLDKRLPEAEALIYTHRISEQMRLDIVRHNAQYQPIQVKTFMCAHDRFLCIDECVYHIGASIKDLGKKWFAFSRMDFLHTSELIDKISTTNTSL